MAGYMMGNALQFFKLQRQGNVCRDHGERFWHKKDQIMKEVSKPSTSVSLYLEL